MHSFRLLVWINPSRPRYFDLVLGRPIYLASFLDTAYISAMALHDPHLMS